MEHSVPPTLKNRPPLGVFIAASVVIFVLTLSAADSFGFVPYFIDGTMPKSSNAPAEESDVSVVTALSQLGPDMLLLDSEGHLYASASTDASDAVHTTLPAHMYIPAIGLDLAVQNPATTNVDVLDALLVDGPARFADSAKLGQEGNMIIFAHSSHLPIVHNQMYKAFNRIPELKAGDSITMTADDGTRFLYSVNSVTKADVNADVKLSLAKKGTKLTLVTCDTLTGKSARYVLEATLIGVVDTSAL